MKQKRYLKLTEAVYKSIEFLPGEEPLAKNIKERSLRILANLILNSLSTFSNPVSFFSGGDKNSAGLEKEPICLQVLTDIEVLKNYLKIGRDQKWIDNINFLVLAKEYDIIKKEIATELEESIKKKGLKKKKDNKEREKKEEKTDSSLNSRQRKILKILKKREKTQVSDLKEVFGNVSKRTLRRDLDDLLKKEKIVRRGEWNKSFYKIKTRT